MNATTTSTREVNVAEIAWQFARLLNEHLTPAQMTEVRKRNAAYRSANCGPRHALTPRDSGICASHDFIDANEVMALAFRAALRREVDLDSDEDLALWGQAWTMAKAKGFRRPTLSAVLRRYGFTLGHTGGNCTAWWRDLHNGRRDWLTVADDPIAPTRWTDTVIVSWLEDAPGEDNDERLLGTAAISAGRLVKLLTHEMLNDYGCSLFECEQSYDSFVKAGWL